MRVLEKITLNVKSFFWVYSTQVSRQHCWRLAFRTYLFFIPETVKYQTCTFTHNKAIIIPNSNSEIRGDSSERYGESASLQDRGCSIIRSGTLPPLHRVAKDFLGNGEESAGPRGDRLGVGNPPRACTRYSLPVVSATLVAKTPPRGFWTKRWKCIKRSLCEEWHGRCHGA